MFSEILDPNIEPLRKRQTGCFSMNYWFALHILHIWLANSLECFFTFSFFSLPSFSVSSSVTRVKIWRLVLLFFKKVSFLHLVNYCNLRGWWIRCDCCNLWKTVPLFRNQFVFNFLKAAFGSLSTWVQYCYQI